MGEAILFVLPGRRLGKGDGSQSREEVGVRGLGGNRRAQNEKAQSEPCNSGILLVVFFS